MAMQSRIDECTALLHAAGWSVAELLLLICLGILQSPFGINLMDRLPGELREAVFHPAVVLGGLASVLTCAPSIVRFRWSGREGVLACSLSLSVWPFGSQA